MAGPINRKCSELKRWPIQAFHRSIPRPDNSWAIDSGSTVFRTAKEMMEGFHYQHR
jgi:hypothetical protein